MYHVITLPYGRCGEQDGDFVPNVWRRFYSVPPKKHDGKRLGGCRRDGKIMTNKQPFARAYGASRPARPEQRLGARSRVACSPPSLALMQTSGNRRLAFFAYRASVMIPLCNVDGVASVLFTKRSGKLRAHKNEVCFPGGKVGTNNVGVRG